MGTNCKVDRVKFGVETKQCLDTMLVSETWKKERKVET